MLRLTKSRIKNINRALCRVGSLFLVIIWSILSLLSVPKKSHLWWRRSMYFLRSNLGKRNCFFWRWTGLGVLVGAWARRPRSPWSTRWDRWSTSCREKEQTSLGQSSRLANIAESRFIIIQRALLNGIMNQWINQII